MPAPSESAEPDRKARRKGGRPRLPDDEKRRGKIGFTPTNDERAEIEGRAALLNLTVAEYVRSACLGAPLSVKQHREFSPGDRHALNRIGININQIAKHLNAGRAINHPTIDLALKALTDFIESARQ